MIACHLNAKQYLTLYSTNQHLYRQRFQFQFTQSQIHELLQFGSLELLNVMPFQPRHLNQEMVLLCFKRGILSFCQELIRQSEEAIQQSEELEACLMEAAIHGHTRVVQLLLEHNIALKDTSILHLAVIYNHMDLFTYAIEKQQLDQLDCRQMTPIQHAVSLGHLKMTQLLIEKGSNPNDHRDYVDTPLHKAVHLNQMEICQFLVKICDVNKKNHQLMTPLHMACMIGNSEMCDLLLREKSDTDARDNTGKTPLMKACIHGHVSKSLLQQSQLDLRDYFGKTATMYSIEHCDLETIELLLKHSNDTPESLLPLTKQDTIRKRILQHTKHIHATIDGRSLVHYCVEHRYLGQLQHLLKRGADPNERDQSGYTPLSKAILNGYKDVQQILTIYGAENPIDGQILKKWHWRD
ncbi:ankyrin repeat-containing domain protein [Gorgonomyces haynaldii]|nr:ankyrin repeat-containing domain protein [Gorgonomyces haynaldii]